MDSTNKRMVKGRYMAVVNSFKKSLLILKNNPRIMALVLIQSLIVSLGFFFEVFNPKVYFGVEILSFFIIPFFMGGAYGMVREAEEKGNTELSTFIRCGKATYFKLLTSLILFFMIFYLPSIIIILRAKTQLLPFKYMHIVHLLVSLIVILSLFFIQFFDTGIFLYDYGVIETFVESFTFVRKRLFSVIGYTLVVIPIFAVSLVLPTVHIYFTSVMSTTLKSKPPIISAVAALLTNLILRTISDSIYYAFHLIFYIESQPTIIRKMKQNKYKIPERR